MKQLRIPRRLLLALPLVVLILLGWWFTSGLVARSKEDARVRKSQQEFFEALEGNQRRPLRSLVSKSYSDHLGHDREAAIARLFELRSEFSMLTIDDEILNLKFPAKDKAKLTFHFTDIRGSGGRLSGPIMSHIRSSGILRDEITAQWQREGIWPGTWRLYGLQFGESFHLPAGYQPKESLRGQTRSQMMP